MKMNILILISCVSMSLVASQGGTVDIKVDDVIETVAPFHKQHEKMTKEEMIKHLKDKIEWIKNMPSDEKQALIDVFVWKLDKAKEMVGEYLDKATSENKKQLEKLRDGIAKAVSKIKAMTPQDKADWKKFLKNELENLKAENDSLKNKVVTLKHDVKMHEIANRIDHLIDWLKDLGKNKDDKESLRKLLVKKIDYMKDYLHHFKGQPKFHELKGKIEELKEQVHQKAHPKIEVLKEKIVDLGKEMLDKLEPKK